MKYLTDGMIRNYVAEHILASAASDDCLTESIGDLLEDYGLDEEEWESEEQDASAVAFKIFDRARVTVVIDGYEYES